MPAKFEAGTPPITEAVGLGAAVDFLEAIGMDDVRQHEMELTRYAIDTLNERFGDDITIHGPDNVEVRGGVLSFAFRDIHPHDVSQVLDQRNVCVRAGHHCAKPLMRVLGVNATARASLYLYNDRDDVDALADALDGATDIFGSDRTLGDRCLASKTSTARSSSTTTARRGTAASCRRHRPSSRRPQPAVRRRDHRVPARRRRRASTIVSDIKVGGQGCSISQSSASMMSQAVKGKSVAEARALVRKFKGMMSIDEADGDDDDGAADDRRSAISRRCRASSSSRCGSSAPRWPGTP